MDKHFESKHTVMGAFSDLAKSLVMLNRKILWQDNGIAKIPGKRHCERVVEALNLQHAKTVVSPSESAKGFLVKARECSWESSQSEEAATHELDADETSLYRSAVARLNLWPVYRPDIQYAVRVCSKSMSSPRVND